MTIRYKFWALALAFCSLAAPALADDQEGMYVFITAGKGQMSNACKSQWINYLGTTGGSTATCNDKNTVYSAGFGYQYTPMWGLQASYGLVGYAGSDGIATLTDANGVVYPNSSYSWQLKATAIAVQAVATLHLSDTLAVFGKAGPASVEFREYMYSVSPALPPGVSNMFWSPVVQTTRTTLAIGGGIKYDVTPHASVLAMVESYGSHDIYNIYGIGAKVRLLTASAGLMYRY